MNKVSIVTLTYKGLGVLKPCVESVLKHCTSIPFQWIIRENSSEDGSLEFLQRVELNSNQQLDIILAKNVGNFAEMNNDLIGETTGEYLLFLNNDIEAKSDFLKPMVEALDNNPDIGSVGAVLRYPNGKIQHCGIVFNENGSAFNLGFPFDKLQGIDSEMVCKQSRLYQAATGACLLVRKSEFEAIGRFDTQFHWCYDDVDLCLALKKPALVLAGHELIHHESWSKAKPANYDALRRLTVKYRLIGDYWNYNLGSYNVILP